MDIFRHIMTQFLNGFSMNYKEIAAIRMQRLFYTVEGSKIIKFLIKITMFARKCILSVFEQNHWPKKLVEFMIHRYL